VNPIAKELNATIARGNAHILEMLSGIGRELFFPKGILSQGAEAKQKAHRLNATIGIATEGAQIMCLPSVTGQMGAIPPVEALTYAPSFGVAALRQAWREEMVAKNPSLADRQVSLPVVTCGITHGVSVFAELWCDPGDGVVLPDMFWGNYNMIFNVRRGLHLWHYPLFGGSGRFNVEAFERRLREAAEGSGKVVALLNFPHNPTGYTVSEDEADAIVAVLGALAGEGIRVLAVTDDSYFGLFFEPQTLKESLFARLCGVDPRLLAVKLDGATKENFVWGLRVGFITYGCHVAGEAQPFYEALEKKSAGCIRGNISNASHLSQYLVMQAMQDPNYAREKQEKFEILRRRAARVREVLADEKYRDAWDVYPFNSGYFMCIRLKTVPAEGLRLHLLDRYGVGLIATGERDLRVAYSCLDESDIPELFDTVLQGVRDLEAAES
jgi:aspartate/methionine/tyrosine aminotransferase